MHCHVLGHMHDGMMGSLLVVQGGQLALGLPQGVPCPPGNTISVTDTAFVPSTLSVPSGGAVTFDFVSPDHTVETTSTTMGAAPININAGGGPQDPIPPGQQRTVTVSGMAGAAINFRCGIHFFTGAINIT